MKTIPVFATSFSPRLEYILHWLLKEVMHAHYRLLTDEKEAADLPFLISYGRTFLNAISIPASGLLEETAVGEHAIETGIWEGIPVLYQQEEAGFNLSFDLFSAIFFLISRYEEYYPFQADKHNRYPPEHSILHKNDWLERPLVDEWIYAFAALMRKKGADLELSGFSFLPTYDIDIAYSYRYKGFMRSAGATLRDLVKGNLKNMATRFAVLAAKMTDPYDSFELLLQLHEDYGFKPVYFILAALKTTAFDKNISPEAPEMIRLLGLLKKDGEIGMHPSYYSGLVQVFDAEKKILETGAGIAIKKSRQHYIKLRIPATYHLLMESGIEEDYSMGYGSKPGFRAGTGRSFPWYDLQHEKITSLIVHPFAFMDTTARFEEGLDANDAFKKLERMKDKLIRTESRLVTIFHNFSLGTDPGWKGWREQYMAFLKRTVLQLQDR